MVLTAAALMAAPRAQAQARVEVTPIVGATLFLDDGPNTFALSRGTKDPLIVQGGKYANALTLGVNAGIRFNDQFAIEGLFSWLPTKLTADNLPESTDVDGYMYGVTGIFYVPVFTKFGPYWGVGVGAESYDYRSGSIESETHAQANFVGGMAFELNDRLGLRIEGRDCLAPFDSGIADVANEWENDLMITAGITWRSALGK
jgi:opacity protein-like surface antigen